VIDYSGTSGQGYNLPVEPVEKAGPRRTIDLSLTTWSRRGIGKPEEHHPDHWSSPIIASAICQHRLSKNAIANVLMSTVLYVISHGTYLAVASGSELRH
jgi:hypothetical protein